jgi:hypothetical protein
LIEKVVKAGIMWVVGLLNPVGAFIKACQAIYKIVMFFIEKGKQIMDFVNSVIDSIAKIVAGNLGGAAKMVEDALARIIPLAIGFLASLLGLDGVSEKVQKIIHAIQAPINKAIDWVLDKAIALAKKLGIDKLVAKVKGGVDKGKDWAKKKVEQVKGKVQEKVGELFSVFGGLKEEFTTPSGEHHTLYFKGEEDNAELILASNPMSYKAFLATVKTTPGSKEETAKNNAIIIAEDIGKKKAEKYPAGISDSKLEGLKRAKRNAVKKLLEKLWKQTNVMLSGSSAPTGKSREDAIPFDWYKPMDNFLYPPVIKLNIGDFHRDSIGHLPIIPGGTKMAPAGVKMQLGISPKSWPRKDKTFQFVPEARGTKAGEFREVLTYFGFDWGGLDADHVQDVHYEGVDNESNLWPFDSSANRSAGSRHNNQIVTFKDDDGTIKPINAGNKKLAGRYFKIKNIGI